MTVKALKKNNMKKGPFKLKSGNKPSIAKMAGTSPMEDEKTKGNTTASKTAKVHDMFGILNDKGTKVVNEQGNWVNISKSTEGTATYNRAKKAGKLSGGPNIK